MPFGHGRALQRIGCTATGSAVGGKVEPRTLIGSPRLANSAVVKPRRDDHKPRLETVSLVVPLTGGRGHFQSQSPLHILGQFSAIPEPSIGSAGNPSPAVFCVGVRE